MVAFRTIAARSSVVLILILVTLLAIASSGEATHVPNPRAVVPVGSHVRSVAVNQVTNRIYAANWGADSVSVIDGATHSLIDTDGDSGNGVTPITVGDNPESIAVDPSTNRIYTANRGGQSVTVIDGLTNAVTATIPIGGVANGLAVNSSTQRVYVGNWATDSVEVIDSTTNTIVGNVPLPAGADPHPLGIAVNETTNRVYVSNYDDPGVGTTVSVIDGATNTEITQVTVASAPSGIAVNETTNRVYVSTLGGVYVIDGVGNTVAAVISISGPTGLAVDSSSNRVYAARESAGKLAVLDGAVNAQVNDVAITASPYAVAVNESNATVYVASWGSNVVTALSFPAHPLGSSLINFQGRLTDSLGNPLSNGNYSITFRLYDALTGGNVKWFETQTVSVSASVFSVLLGSVNPLEAGHFNGEPRYLEVQVETDPPLSPRQQITSVPYAFNSQSLDGVGASQFLRRDTSDSFLGTQLTLGSAGTNTERLKVLGQAVIETSTTETIWRLKNTSADANEWLLFSTGTGSSKGTRRFVIQDATEGANADRLTVDSEGNVGIGTNSPQSRLQIPSGYIQLPTISGGTPPAADCDDASEAGRMVVRTDGATNLYICTGATGWVGK